MSLDARTSDNHMGICAHGAQCCPHSVIGTIVQGSPNVFVNGRPAARLNDMVRHSCPHCGVGWVDSASSSVFANGIPVARSGDRVRYPGGRGSILSGSSNTIVGG